MHWRNVHLCSGVITIPAAAVVQLLQGDLEAVHHVLAPALALRPAPAAAAAEQVENVCHAAAAATAAALLGCVLAKLLANTNAVTRAGSTTRQLPSGSANRGLYNTSDCAICDARMCGAGL